MSVNLCLGVCVHRDGRPETVTRKCVQEAVHTQGLSCHPQSSSSEHVSPRLGFLNAISKGNKKHGLSEKKKKKTDSKARQEKHKLNLE